MAQQQTQQQQQGMPVRNMGMQQETFDDDDMQDNERSDLGPITDSVVVSHFSYGRRESQCHNDMRTLGMHKNEYDPPECILSDLTPNTCGAVNTEKKFGIDCNSEYLLIGPFCEYHYMKYLNGVYANVKRCNEWKFLPVNYSNIQNTQVLFPIWSLQPINSTADYFRQMLDNTRSFCSESSNAELDYLSKLLATGTMAMTNGEFSTMPNNYYTRIILESCNQWSKVLSDPMKCWENDKVYLYFSKDYIEENLNNKFLINLAKNSPRIDHNEYSVFEANITAFPIFDILLLKSFEPSTLVNGHKSTGRMHNIQIINGTLVYGTGNGLSESFPHKADEQNIGIEYVNDNLRKIIKDRKFFNTIQVLTLDSVSMGKQQKSVFPRFDIQYSGRLSI